MEELTITHMFAQMLNQKASLAEGYTAPTRWLTLRKDLQAKYIAEATKMFEEWRDDELKAKKSRE